jgi:hypothetical protein
MNTQKKPKKQTKETASKSKQAFIKLYPEYGSVGATLKAIGIKSRWTFYCWLKDEKFKALYENELLPNRRDEVVSWVYRVATNRLGTHIKTVTYKNGTVTEEEVSNEAPPTQLTSAYGFLKATDHIEEPDAKDRLVFCEKNQIELTGKDGRPLPIGETNVFNYNIGKEGIAEALEILISAGAARLADVNEPSNQIDEVHSP